MLKELNFTINPFTGHTLRGLLIQVQNISLGSSGMGRKQNFFPLFFHFYCLIFFSFTEYLVGFILVRKKFRKAFRILGLDERRDRWVVEQDFHGHFQINVTQFLLFAPVPVTELWSLWYGLKDLFTLHKLADKVVLDH